VKLWKILNTLYKLKSGHGNNLHDGRCTIACMARNASFIRVLFLLMEILVAHCRTIGSCAPCMTAKHVKNQLFRLRNQSYTLQGVFFPKYFYDVLQSTQYEQINKIVKGKISFHQYEHFAYAEIQSLLDLGM
jgi:hypothetical protein